jgi:hypothetical protein
MDKTGHLSVGISIGILFIIITNLWLSWFDTELETIIVCIIIMLVYSLLPDMDTKSGTINTKSLGRS